MMKDYEKLILLLEMQKVDVSPFLKLKKNELALKGAFDIFSKDSYKAVVSEKKLTTESDSNVFFMSLNKNSAKKISEIVITHYKNNEQVTIKEIFEDHSLTEQEKYDLIYRGVERLNNDYKRFMSYLTINNQTVLKEFSKLIEDKNQDQLLYKLIRKFSSLYIILMIILIFFDLFILKTSYLKENAFFVGVYNTLLVYLLSYTLVKRVYLRYFSNRPSKTNQRIHKFNTKCEELLKSNDKSFSKLEKDLYRFSSNLKKDQPITYLQRTNKLIVKMNLNVENIFKQGSKKSGEQVFNITLKVLNYVPFIGLSILLAIALI